MEKDKKLAIIMAAEEVMSRKSLVGSKITEIAKKADVTESLIYKYFKGKEDLLYAIPGVRMEEVLNSLDEQLQGIVGADSQLSKLIWFHLKYNDTHPEYARILFMECRLSKEFYTTLSYQLVRKYVGVLSNILQKGVDDGIFRPDLDIGLVRDIILGTLTYETVTCLALNETKESISDFEGIMSLINTIISTEINKVTQKVKKSDRILMAAEKVFAEKGFNKAKVSDVAKLSGVADGTVYEYFTNKEDLLLSIPLGRFDRLLAQLQELYVIKTPYRKLRRLIKYHFSFFFAEREFLEVFLLQIQLNRNYFASKAYKKISKYFKLIEEVIDQGKSEGVFFPNSTSSNFSKHVYGDIQPIGSPMAHYRER